MRFLLNVAANNEDSMSFESRLESRMLILKFQRVARMYVLLSATYISSLATASR